MNRWLLVLWVALAAMLVAIPHCAAAHEVRPAYLLVEETSQDQWLITWKQPILEGKRLKLAPQFSEFTEGTMAECAWEVEARENLTAATVERGALTCDIALITIVGLERTLTDTIVDVRVFDRDPVASLLRPDARSLDLRKPVASPASTYLLIGVEHIVFGWDHLLFVIALVILVASPRRVIGVITAFTVAHSLTLGLASLGILGVPSRPVEVLIAASIVLLAWEILRKMDGREGLVVQRPYLVAMVVGLVHGLGFAGALSDIGLPEGTELLALLMFNLGVEFGQIAVILSLLGALWLLARAPANWQNRAFAIVAYGVGAIGTYWMIERLAGYFA